jgi:hypothetical protein
MFFYTFHHLNQYVFPEKDIKDPIFNVRAIIVGGIAYIVFHNYLNSIDSSYKEYFKWIVSLDIIAMAVIYNSYYSESILKKIRTVFNPPSQKRIDDKSIGSKKSRVARDTASYFNASIAESDEPSIRELEDIDEEDEEDEEQEYNEDSDDKSVQDLINKMVSGTIKSQPDRGGR